MAIGLLIFKVKALTWMSAPHLCLGDLRYLAPTSEAHLALLHDRKVMSDDATADRAQHGMAGEVACHATDDGAA